MKIPIEAAGTGADGKPFHEKTQTLIINRHGARISLRASPRKGEQITITNLYNRLTCPFRVVSQMGKSLGEGLEWGVECLEPERDFWGIYFPETGTKPGEAQPELIDALLECSKCFYRELAQLTQEQFLTLSQQSSLQRPCSKCNATTDWKFSFTEEEEAVPEQPFPAVVAPAASAEKKERRRNKRLTMKVPLRIRLADGRENITRTENYSKSGVCFISSLDMKEAERVKLTVSYSVGSHEIEVPARIVWKRPLDDANQIIYGAELETEAKIGG